MDIDPPDDILNDLAEAFTGKPTNLPAREALVLMRQQYARLTSEKHTALIHGNEPLASQIDAELRDTQNRIREYELQLKSRN